MGYAAGYLVKVWRGTLVDDPYAHGEESAEDQELDWSDPTLAASYPLCPVAPGVMAEDPSVNAPLSSQEVLSVYLPYGANVVKRDRVELSGGPHDGTYEVDGMVAHWLNPYTGSTPGAVAILGRRLGG